MMAPTFLGLGLASMASLGLAIPVPQFQQPWNGFFLPEQTYDPQTNRPYNPYAVPAQPRYPYSPQPYYGPPPPPPSPPSPYVSGNTGRPIYPPEQKPEAPPPNYERPNYGPIYGSPPPNPYSSPFRPYASPPPVNQAPAPPTPAPPSLKAVEEDVAGEAPQKQKSKLSLSEKLSAAEDAAAPAIEASPVGEKEAARRKQPVGNSDEDLTEDNAIRYHVNVGGIQKGAGGGTTNFHVYTDESGTKKFSDELDPDTEKYITESMIPKLGGKRKKTAAGGVWSVFGDK
ncbi:hypothetical protein L873DRAFT_892647 [Choiromyces venosus 120613-1]|uniref:Uncharacterized protein n=1 Tax=Choiromyces venosus 120613-1 TaxID=1336337 RepID=A0A3N4JRW1_9PEZI|nr:hypothetical protein L873DRAFT_892647 [Choiromyces venosus 120613-1]